MQMLLFIFNSAGLQQARSLHLKVLIKMITSAALLYCDRYHLEQDLL